jgi:hypothetical protein
VNPALLALCAVASVSDVVEQHLFVDLSGDVLRVELDAVVVGDALPTFTPPLPIVESTVDGAPAELTVDPQYDGMVTWIDVGGDDAPRALRLVFAGEPTCTSLAGALCGMGVDERVLLPAAVEMSWYLWNLEAFDPFTGTIAVRAPAGFVVVAGQGTATEIVDEGDTQVHRFAYDEPTDMLGVYAARATQVVVEGDVRVVASSTNADDAAVLQRLADGAAAVLPRYAAAYGALPVDEVHVSIVHGRYPFGGLGLFGNVLIGEFLTTPAYEFMIDQGIAHETAHTWWGGLAEASEPDEGGFLHEAFAEYSAWRALGADDDGVRTAGARMNAVWYLANVSSADGAILDESLRDRGDAYVLATYHKGSVALRQLEAWAGTEAFTDALAALVARAPGGFTVAGLVEEIEAASGVDVTRAVDEWLRAPGFPVVRTSMDEARTTTTLSVDEDFDLRLDVVATYADGTTDARVVDVPAGGAATTTWERAPVVVSVDPRWTAPRVVRAAIDGDVTNDGRVDALDLIEVALHVGGAVPAERRKDGSYDPLYDLDGDDAIDADDVAELATR